MNYIACFLIAALAILNGLVSGEYQDSGNSNLIGGGGGGGRRRVVGGGIGGSQGPSITIVRDDRTQTAQGDYNFVYETSDGTQRQEQGTQDDGQITQRGWSYTSPEGIPIHITFVADHGGYQPQGSALPVAPELPYRREQQFIH